MHEPPPWRVERKEDVSAGSSEEKEKMEGLAAKVPNPNKKIPVERKQPVQPAASYGMMDITGKKFFFNEDLWQDALMMHKCGADPTTISEELGIPFGCLVSFIDLTRVIAEQVSEHGKTFVGCPKWMEIAAVQWHESHKFLVGKIMQGHIYKALRGNMESTKLVLNQMNELLGDPPPRRDPKKPGGSLAGRKDESDDPRERLKNLLKDGEKEGETVDMSAEDS